MTRGWRVALAAVGLAAAGIGPVLAHEGDEGGTVQKVTGEVVDLACYLSEGAAGPGHRECAEKCIRSGLPVGIKSGDQLYVAIGSEHGPANAALAPLAAKQVVAEGVVSERNGVHLIAIQKVTVKE
ncbi:MAG: hypothetical protein HYZ93_03910 [Candidatus Omnitrophica bacterium]|nr:hypothetical protein [Candidatus Omnitrophota bacterium]